MDPSHEDLEKVYQAIVYIEKERVLSLKAYPRTITSFLHGSELSPYFSIYQKHPDVCGSLKTYDVEHITSLCDSLAATGYLAKHRRGDKILYATTQANFLLDGKASTASPLNSFFRDRISPNQQAIVDTFVKHFSKDWSGIECLDFKSYFGFKAKYCTLNPNPNWFWLSAPEGALNCLQIKVRMSPDKVAVGFNWIFNLSKAPLIIAKLDEILSYRAREFHLRHHQNGPSQGVRPAQEVQKAEHVETTKTNIDYFDLKSMCHNGLDFYINDGSADPTEALLLTGENSPFAFSQATILAPESEMKALLKGVTNFDFAIRKWKLVAWSSLASRPEAVQDVLLLGKKTKCTWILVNIPKRSVIAFTKLGFFLILEDKKVASADFVGLI
jgi:hypothetical protein